MEEDPFWFFPPSVSTFARRLCFGASAVTVGTFARFGF